MSNRFSRAMGVVLVSAAALGQVRGAVALAPDSKDAAESGDSPEVSELIERGIALRRGGDDARALELFKQAEKHDPNSPRVQVHLAATYQALGNWELADHYLNLSIKNPDDPYVQKHQGVLAAARRTIDGHIGTLQVSGGPDGAEIRLNGRSIGTLPIAEPVRVEAGIYTLEARLPGHYPITRSVALAGGTLVRESITLTPVGEREEDGAASPPPASAAPPEKSGASWLTWTFGGLAVGAGVGTVAAWATRERHVGNWNDDSRCLRAGQTRGQVCASERDAGDRAETWMWIAGAATGAFAVASVVSFWVDSSDNSERAPELAVGCGVGLGQLSCSGRF